MMTGKNGNEKREKGSSRPFPVKKVLDHLCMTLNGLEGILRVVSLYLYKNNIIDRKWMNVLIFIVNLLNYLCSNLSKDNKLKGTEK